MDHSDLRDFFFPFLSFLSLPGDICLGGGLDSSTPSSNLKNIFCMPCPPKHQLPKYSFISNTQSPNHKKMIKMQNSHNLVIFQPTLSISRNQKVRILLRCLQFFKWMMDGHEGQDILFGVKLSNIISKLSASFHS